MVHDGADRRLSRGSVSKVEAKPRLLLDLLCDRVDPVLVQGDLLGPVLPELGRRAADVETVSEPPVVFGLAGSIAVGRVGRIVRLLKKSGKLAERVGCGAPRCRQTREGLRCERTPPEIRRCRLRKSGSEVPFVGGRAGDAVVLYQPAIRQVPFLLSREQGGTRSQEVARDRFQPLDHEGPLRLAPELTVGSWLHLLLLPVQAPKRLRYVCIDGALVVPALFQLTQQEADLGAQYRVVDALAGLEPGRIYGLPRPLDLPVERGFGLERIGPPVAQRAVRSGQRGTVAVPTEVGGGDGVELECAEEIPIAERRESATGQSRSAPCGRCRVTAAAELAQDSESGSGTRGADKKTPSMHGGIYPFRPEPPRATL